MSIFSDEFRERVKDGKYSKWAASMTADQLEALIWAIGEYACRSEEILQLLRERETPSSNPLDGNVRARKALEIIARYAWACTADGVDGYRPMNPDELAAYRQTKGKELKSFLDPEG